MQIPWKTPPKEERANKPKKKEKEKKNGKPQVFQMPQAEDSNPKPTGPFLFAGSIQMTLILKMLLFQMIV